MNNKKSETYEIPVGGAASVNAGIDTNSLQKVADSDRSVDEASPVKANYDSQKMFDSFLYNEPPKMDGHFFG